MSPRGILSPPRNLSRLVVGLIGVVALLVVSACQASPATTPAGPVELKITIAGGKVDPSGAQVDVPRGATVHVTATSDTADTIHVHGYDREAEVGPGKSADFTFVADRVGRFEVESHHPQRVIARLNVR